MHVLLVEDDAALAQVLSRGLEANGYRVRWERDGEAAYDPACVGAYDILVLDVMLPGLGGLELLAALRAAGVRQPVLLLTARSSVADRVRGLDAGADDYLLKPFAFEELLARLRALLRRPAARPLSPLPVAGNLRLDLDEHMVVVGGRLVDVPRRELDLLEYLLRHPGQALTREQILVRVWGSAEAVRANVADATVSRLRRRLAAAGWDGHLLSVAGVGYRLMGPKGDGGN